MDTSAPTGVSKGAFTVRAVCGTINPRKDIPPTSETLAPAKSRTTRIPINLTSWTLMPRPMALSSPRASADNRPESANPMIPATIINGTIRPRLCQVIPDKLPALQKERTFVTPKAMETAWLIAVSKAEIAAPARISRKDSAFLFPAPNP